MAANQQSKNDLRESSRVKAASLRAQQQKKEARVRRMTFIAIFVGIAIVGGLIAFVVMSGTERAKVDESAAAPAVATATDGGIPFDAAGTAGASNDGAVEVAVYADYLCPYCAMFEEANQAVLTELRESGDITLVIHPLSMLSGGSKSAYSSRAASAFSYVAQNAPAHALAFNDVLFTNQPPESGSGLSDDEIVSLAQQAGVPDDVAKASVGGEFIDWTINLSTQAANNEAVAGERGLSTPTVLIDGVKWTGNISDPEALRTAVQEAQNDGDAPAVTADEPATGTDNAKN